MWGLEHATFRYTSKALNHYTVVAADLLVSGISLTYTLKKLLPGSGSKSGFRSALKLIQDPDPHSTV